MVTCNLTGGTYGNHLCEVATTIAYAHKHHMPYAIPCQSILPRHWPVTYFNCQPQTNETGIHQVAYQDINQVFKEAPDQSYTEIPYYDHVKLDGLFQSYKYFQDYLPQIRSCVRFNFWGETGWVAIHVRRGDYLKFPVKHPTITVGYLTQAIEYMVGKGETQFAVFSDDQEWCRENIPSKQFPKCQFEFANFGTAVQDFHRMANCHHQIISNSSYSMMAAHFNPHDDKIVIAPAIWTYENSWNTQDLIPPEWIRL